MPFYSKLFLLSRMLSAPLEIIFALLIFILSKNLEVIPLQLTIIACIKPISSLFAFYLSSAIFDNPHRTRGYLLLNILIGSLPCFFYPFTDNVWFYIGSYALFMISFRATAPAWIEVLKRNTEPEILTKTFSYGNSIYYFMTIFVSPLICYLMDWSPQLWRYLFLSLAALKLINIALVFAIRPDMKIQLHQPFMEPLKKGWSLMKAKPAFTHYLLLYCIGGAGIIGTQSILPLYFKDVLNLSYTQLGFAFSFSKGISYVLSSTYWSKYTQKFSLYQLNALANLFTVLYFALLMASSANVNLLYLAYISYGVMLSGTDLSRDLSGPQFAGSKDSTIYSSLNLVLIGIRGCIFPALGSLLYAYTGPSIVFTTAASICLLGSFYGLWADRRYPTTFPLNKEARSYG